MRQHAMMRARGRTVILFYIDGQPGGMVTGAVSNWPGRILMIPRTQIKEGLARKEVGNVGVYFLLGEDEKGVLAYIGEAENIGKRIRSHTAKDWWTNVVIITAVANYLNKAHVQYLEARLIDIATKVRKRRLDNTNKSAEPSLSEADQSNMEGFLDNSLLVLSSLGIDWFIDDTRPDDPDTLPSAPAAKPRSKPQKVPKVPKVPEVAEVAEVADVASVAASPTWRRQRRRRRRVGKVAKVAASPIFVLKIPKHGIRATARVKKDGKLVVQKGSKARLSWSGRPDNSYAKRFKHLCVTGVLKISRDGSHRVFTKDRAFSSTSAAGAAVTGWETRGPVLWKTEDGGKTYKEWEAEQAASKSRAAKVAEVAEVAEVEASLTFVLEVPRHGIRATARLKKDGKLVVQKGSKARLSWSGRPDNSSAKRFKRLCATGILKKSEDGSHRVFTKDCAFSNTSAAGAAVTGRVTGGPASWKTEDGGKTYKEWEAEQPASKSREAKVAKVAEVEASPTFVLEVPRHGIRATARLEKDGRFVVQKGSKARSSWSGPHTAYTELFKRLCDTGILKVSRDGSHCVFTENYAFTSPTAAGVAVTGRTTSGPMEWKTKDSGKTYKAWEAEQLASASG